MAKMSFREFLNNKNTSVSAHKSAFDIEGVDIDFSIDALVEFTLEPDERRYGLDGIAIEITSVRGHITWTCHYADVLTPEETKLLLDAGGKEYMNDTIEGVIPVDTSNTAYPFTIECDMQFDRTGHITVQNVEIELPTESTAGMITVS